MTTASPVRVRLNRHSFAFSLLVLAMLYAAAVQENGSVYLLAFVVIAIAAVSWFHARLNLTAIQLRAGAMNAEPIMGELRLPLWLSMGDGRQPCGVEVTARGCKHPAFIETLEPEQSQVVSLDLRTPNAGWLQEVVITVRSYYPLGLFTAERQFKLPIGKPSLPGAAGDLPLPVAEPSPGETANAQSTAMQPGGGDDFAGFREWQPGDSLRQVDWKAVARGRPMHVRLWAQSRGDVVWFDWAYPPLPEAVSERVAQLLAWIEKAEAGGQIYGLRLGETIIEPDIGPAHRQRCLQALAKMQAEGSAWQTLGEATLGNERSPAPTRELASRIEGRPLFLLGLALIVALLPILFLVPIAGPLALLLGMALRWWIERNPTGHIARSPWLRFGPIFLGGMGTYFMNAGLTGLEGGIAVLLSVSGGKIMEARTPRDFQIIACLGWFLCLCVLALDQSIGHSLIAYGTFFLIGVSLVRFRRGSAGIKLPSWVCGSLLVQAVPLIVLLFLFYPRGSFGLTQLRRHLQHQTGISNVMEPGKVAEIAKSDARAFYATLPDGQQLSRADLYWRCLVLWQCHGMTWRQGTGLATVQGLETVPFDQQIRQEITLEPTGSQWLPSLDLPVKAVRGSFDMMLDRSAYTLLSDSPVDGLRRYEVRSVLLPKYQPLPQRHRDAALLVLGPVSAEVRALAASFAKHGKPQLIRDAALQHLRVGGFRYTLTPGAYYGPNAMDTFLFQRKLGFCEHFAATFATLMRLAGVPARTVIGYMGGEYRSRGDYYTVRQQHAHAWAEIWTDELGWERVDPVAALSPSRLSDEFSDLFDEMNPMMSLAERIPGFDSLKDGVMQVWDDMNFVWYDQVVQFNRMEQRSLWQDLGVYRQTIGRLLLWAFGLVVLPLVGLWLYLRRPHRARDPVVRAWLRFCRYWRGQGHARLPYEGPLDYATRLAQAYPKTAPQIMRVAELYAQLRYGASPGPDPHLFLASIRDAKRHRGDCA
jgi:protein-glutamine gamma-glutamyltransferase